MKGRFPRIILSSYFPGSPVNFEQVREDFKGEMDEVLSLYFTYHEKQIKLFLLGLGESANYASCLHSFQSLSARYQSKLTEHIVFGMDHFEGFTIERIAHCYDGACQGLEAGMYDMGMYKTEKQKPAQAKKYYVLSQTTAEDSVLEAIDQGLCTADTRRRIRDLVNAPSNLKSPELLANWVRSSAEEFEYEVIVLDKKALAEQHFHAVLAVNRGSENPAVLVHAKYQPVDTKGLPKVALVGKGVTFDTGGLSIKPSQNMHYMKSDMGGAAAVLGAIELTARLKIPVELHAIVPFTDNSVDAMSVKPGDVIRSYSGKTIEIIDTDAEGRLILADALSYAVRTLHPDILIDLATLTGSSVRALGHEAAALFSHSDGLVEELEKAGLQSGERVWRMPLWKAYHDLLYSDIADIRNLGTKPIAGAITAAKFLEFFVDQHPRWAHLDIAGMAFKDHVVSKQYSATGYGVRLLVDFLKSLQGKDVSSWT